jgi:uncharacterized protein (DUF4415 family)
MWLAGKHVATLDQDLAAVGPQKAIQQIEQRRLAGAVGADDAQNLVTMELEADVLDGLQAPETRFWASSAPTAPARRRCSIC